MSVMPTGWGWLTMLNRVIYEPLDQPSLGDAVRLEAQLHLYHWRFFNGCETYAW